MSITAGAKLQKAAGLLQAGRLDEGERLCREVLKEMPGQADALHFLAMASVRRGDPKAAEQLFRQSLSAQPRQPAVLGNFANMLSGLGRAEEAVPLYRKAVELDARFLNGWMGLATALSAAGQHANAVLAANKVVQLAPESARAWELLGFVQRHAGDGAAARSAYDKGLAIEPKSARIWYNLGVLLREMSEFAAAADAFRRARENGLDIPELYQNLAEAYYEAKDVGQALEEFDRAIKRFPNDPKTHFVRAKFFWETGQDGDHLGKIREAIKNQPGDVNLWGTYFDLLGHQGRFDEILENLQQVPPDAAQSPRLRLVRAVANSGSKNFERATEQFEQLLEFDPSGLPPRRAFAEHLLKAGLPERVDDVCEEIIAQLPYDIAAWCLKGTAWQLLADSRADWVFDFERMVRPIEVPLPDGFSDRAAYFDMVRQELEKLHQMKAHPLDQTLRGGTQTNGFLFKMNNPVVRQLGQQIIKAVESALPEFPDDPDNPFWARNTGRVEFSGAWSVRLRSQGFHTNHYHPEGWISSALYIALPDVVHEEGSKEGHIQFGVPVDELELPLKAARTIEPQVGTLAMFPSYMWHGTIPFTSDQPRITCAYDLVPVAIEG